MWCIHAGVRFAVFPGAPESRGQMMLVLSGGGRDSSVGVLQGREARD